MESTLHLETIIRRMEDDLLRSKNPYEIERLQVELRYKRMELQKKKTVKRGLLKPLLFFAKNAGAIMKGGISMILFTILAIILLALIVAAILIVSIGGTAFILVFGDLLVCCVIIGWIIRKMLKK